MTTKKYVEVPEEFTGKPLEARITSITQSFKFADIFLEIFLPENQGSVSYKRRLWSRIPHNSRLTSASKNEAALYLWRNILGIPDSINNAQLIEEIDTLSMLDMMDYRLEVSMEPGEGGRRYLKVISYDAIPLDWEAMRKKYREMLMEVRSLEQKLEIKNQLIESLSKKPDEQEIPEGNIPKMETVTDFI